MNGRRLTEGECRLAHAVFGAGLNTAAVRIHAGAWWLQVPATAMVCGNRVYFPPAHCRADFAAAHAADQAWLLHELTHVWQYQHGFPLLLGGVWLALCGGYWRRRAYRYPPPAGLASLGELNLEQQAQLVAHYWLASRHGDARYRADLSHYRRLLRPLAAAVPPSALLPRYGGFYAMFKNTAKPL